MTGLPEIPANQLEIAIRGWEPRLLAHGVDPNDYRRITSGLESWAGWLEAWVAAGEAHAAVALDAEAHGRVRTSGEAFVRAALYLHFGAFLSLEDPARYSAVTQQATSLHRQGMTRLDPTFERHEIAFADDRIVANLRRPAGIERPPAVILVPGLDSTKEEFPLWEETFLHRGVATISLDGPGQGEAGFVNPIRPDYEAPVGVLLDAIRDRTDLDPTRIGITGIGLGGYYAARAAAFEPRIAAVGVVGGAYRFARMPHIIRRKFLHSAHLNDVAAAASLSDQFTLDRIAAKIRQPYLVIHGGGDAVMDVADARRPTLEAPRGEFHLYPDGNTVCQNVSHLFKPYLADWMGEKLREA